MIYLVTGANVKRTYTEFTVAFTVPIYNIIILYAWLLMYLKMSKRFHIIATKATVVLQVIIINVLHYTVPVGLGIVGTYCNFEVHYNVL